MNVESLENNANTFLLELRYSCDFDLGCAVILYDVLYIHSSLGNCQLAASGC
jgi:hypothetical protein